MMRTLEKLMVRRRRRRRSQRRSHHNSTSLDIQDYLRHPLE
jgi:hypothetical protein